jgi:hypothetical protein
MAYLTSELISNAYYISNIVSREFETVTGAQASDGLSILNDIIADKTANSSMIPYSDKYEFNAVAGTSEYYVPGLIYADTLTFYIDSIRYQTRNQQRQDFFGSFRATDIQSLPFNWHAERLLDGTNIYLYFVPDQAYPIEIWGSFSLSAVTQFQDLSLTLDRYYINFLKFELAVRLCTEYGYTVPPRVAVQLEEYYRWINASTNTVDLKMQKLSTLNGGTAINYAMVNLSGGWVPN